MSSLDTIKSRFTAGEIKQQHLETVIFTEIYQSDPQKVGDAGRDAAVIRAEALEDATGADLSQVKGCQVDNTTFAHGTVLPGIEMKVGSAMIPLGVAGPVRINGKG